MSDGRSQEMPIAALVLGICAVALNPVVGCIPLFGPIICLTLGTLAIIFAALSMKKEPEKKGLNIAGLVLGIVGAAWGLIDLVICGACLGLGAAAAGAAGSAVEDILNSIETY
jgi:uncharacterized membrane protein YvlD (DUF360 family)